MICGTLAAHRMERTVARAAERRVLIVDDDPALRSMLADLLAIIGYTTHEAGNGLEALSFARSFRPDAITLDLNLPRLDGNSVLRELSDDPVTRHVPVVVVSSDTSELEATAQVVAVLEKPFEVDRFLSVVAAAARRPA